MSGKKDATPDEASSVAQASSDEKVLDDAHVEDARRRPMTEKGYHYVMDVKTNNLKSKKRELVQRMRSTLLERGQSVDLSKFKRELSEAQVIYGEFRDIVGGIKEVVIPGESIEEIERICVETEQEWSKFEADIRAEIKHLETIEYQKLESAFDAASSKGSSRVSFKDRDSLKSKRSSTSSVKSDKFQLRKKEAALKVKLAFADEERKLKMEQKKVELMKLEQEQRLEELRLKSKLAQNQAKLNVCLAEEKEEIVDREQDLGSVPPVDKAKDMDNFLKSIPVTSDIEQTPVHQNPIYSSSQVNGVQLTPSPQQYSTPNPNATPFTPVSIILEKCMDKLVETSSKLVAATVEQNQVNRQLAITGQLPKISIPVFSGDPLQYPSWNSSFGTLIDSKPMDAQTKLNFLNQYLTGKPKQVVDQYLLIGTEDAYQSARKLLKERYGNCNVVGSAFLNKLENWPKVGIKDAEALRDLSDFLEKIKAARETTPSLEVLDFARENVKILSKLPVQLQSKWRGNVKKCRALNGDGAYPPFTEFAAFVKECAERANIPELEDLTRTRETVKPNDHTRKSFKDKEVHSFATQGSEQNRNSNNQSQGKKENSQTCLFCKEHHHLDNCKKFAEMSHRDRKDFFFEKFLCFGCASSRQHQAASCKNKLVCRVCSKTHPTCLHLQKDTVEATSNCTNVCTIPEQGKGSDHAMIVPVWVRHISKPSQEVLHYAVLDDQSNVSFVSQSLCEKLNLQGSPTDLLLTTVQERNVHTPSSRICGLEVLDLKREHSVKLPMLFTRDAIPASRSQIPKASVAQEWEHLRPIAEKLMPYDPNVEISLLIGNNCPSIVRPREVVVGKDDDPYGQKSLMGWGIVGRVCKSTSESGESEAVCNKIVASETHEHFTFSTKVKEVINPQRIIQVLESDFVESSTRSKSYSVEDQRFLSVLENGIVKRSDGHYEMPLPLKMDKVSLPYNHQLAVKRWHQLLQGSSWLTGPAFLWREGAFQPQEKKDIQVEKDDPEVKKGNVFMSHVESTATYCPDSFKSDRLAHVSSWWRLLKVVALCLQLKSKLTNRKVKLNNQANVKCARPLPRAAVSLTEFQFAEKEVLKIVQREHFYEEIQVLVKLQVVGEVSTRESARQRNQTIKMSSCLYRLDPFLDDDGLIRVGGRIKRADLPVATKHPVILPRKSPITDLLIKFYHAKVNHMGRGITQNELRQRGYWVVGGSSAVSNCISKCVTCRKLRRPLESQKMADLPIDRVEPSPPFSYCGVDFFGPFLIKERRSEVKRYGVIFTCMASRSIHLETANSLNTSSFISALSRFLHRRGPVRQLRCDQGTNFVGAQNELKAALEELNQEHLQEYLVENGCEWIPFQMNVPHSSHMGGVWERLIRTVRSALETLIVSAGTQLDDEAFRTLMTEVECIVNSRPLTVSNLNDPDAPEPLTPNHLLTLKQKVVLPPPGKFQRADLYCRKWWRRVQYLANQFWVRWRHEFLQNLQSRSKWMRPTRNLMVGDIVISKEDEGPRNQWPLAKVVEVYPSEDGYVRKVKILKADGELDNKGRRQKPPSLLDRPIHKLVLLLPCDES